MKKALVAGGAGFIGSHLCDLLIEKGFQVVCVDNLITGSKKNIKHLKTNNGFKFIKADIVKDGIKMKNIDYVFHFASPASTVDYRNYPEKTALVNSIGTLNLLKLAVKNKARFLFASTSEIYGDPLVHPQKENYWGNVNSFGPRSCYDEGKRFGEAITYVYLNKYKVDARIIRIFNTYGPKMQKNDGRVVSNFINQALENKPLTVYGNGRQTRSFCYVSDLIEGIIKVMFTRGIRGEVFNLGNPQEYKIIDFAKKIKNMIDSKSKVVLKSLPIDDPKKRRPNISKAKKILNWKPKVSIDKGLEKTISYYKGL